MSKGKCRSTFSPQMEAIVFIILQIFLATGADLKFGKILGYSSVFGHLTFLDQSRASENISWIKNLRSSDRFCFAAARSFPLRRKGLLIGG